MKAQFILILLLISTLSIAQIGGNQLYQSNNSSSQASKFVNYTMNSTDSTLNIGGSILLNKKADYYLLTLGTKESSKTVIKCNRKLDTRIDAFIMDLRKEKINKEDIYIDFISQIKIYDHKIERDSIIEFFDGFETRKNIIIKLSDLGIVDKVIGLASKQEFYDIIKVEYFNENVEDIYNELFDEAIDIINKYKLQFEKYCTAKTTNNYRITIADFKAYPPKNRYRQYNEAFETSIVTTNYSRSYIKKEARKEKTFYYEGVENNLNVDRIIDDISPVIGIQYVLNVSILYELEK